MPVLTIGVERVTERHIRTIKGPKRKFDVIAAGEGPGRVYETWDAWIASLCDRASRTGTSVTIHTRDTRWGPEIVKVEPV